MAKQIFIKFTIDGAIVQAESSAANIRQGDSNGEVSIIASVTGRTNAGYLARVHFERPDGKKANVVMTPSSEYSDRFVYVCESAWFFAVPGQAKATVTITDSGGAVSAQGTYEFAVAATTVDVIDSTLTYDEAAALEGLIADVSAQVSALSKLTSNPVTVAYSLTRNAFRTVLSGYTAEAFGDLGGYIIKKNGASLTEQDVLEYMSVMFGTEAVPFGTPTNESGRQAILFLQNGEMYRIIYSTSGGVHDLYALRLSCSPAKLREELGQAINTAALTAGGQNTKITANDSEVEVMDETTKNGLHVGGGIIYFVSLNDKYYLPNNPGPNAFTLASKAYADSAAATVRSALQAEIDTVNATQNVVDIVGTKANLLAYVTTNLQSGDKIEVLVDESQNGANTIYSWTGSAWALIGSKAPYYSISQIDSLLQSYATASWVDSNYMSLTKGGVVNLAEAPSSPSIYYFGAKNGTSSFFRLSDNSADIKTTRGDVMMMFSLNFSTSSLARFTKIDSSTTPNTLSVTDVPFKQGVHSLVLDDDLTETNARVTASEAKIAKQESDIQYLYRQVIGGGDLATETDSGVSLTSQSFPLTISPKALLDYVGGMCQKVNQLINPIIWPASTTLNGITYTNNGDGSITVSGTATADSIFASSTLVIPNGHKVLLEGCPKNGSSDTYHLFHMRHSGASYVSDYGAGAIATVDTTDGNTRSVVIRVRAGVNLTTPITFKPRIADIGVIWPTDTPTSTSDARIQRLMSYLSSHPEYDAGSILTAPVTKVVSKGFNLWDEEVVDNGTRLISKNYTEVLPNTTYYLRGPAVSPQLMGDGFTWYDKDYNAISTLYYSNNVEIVPPVGAKYFKFRLASNYGLTYNHDICINRSSSLNGTYMPYRAPIEYPIPAEVRALEGYGWGLSAECNNHVSYEGKSYSKAVRRVDLGSLDWEYNSNGVFRSLSDPSMGMVVNPQNALCDKYAFNGSANDSTISAIASNLSDKQICGYSNAPNANRLVVKDSSAGTDEVAFKQAMSGVYLYYELATPTETDISEYIDSDVIEVSAGGHLEFVNEDGIGVPYSTTYQCEPNP